MKRVGMVTRVKHEKLGEYRRLHADAWPGVLATITANNIRNYTIYLATLPDGHPYLFSHFDYVGTDFDADMARIAANPVTQRWWAVCKPCLAPIAELPPGEVWAPMTEVFHLD